MVGKWHHDKDAAIRRVGQTHLNKQPFWPAIEGERREKKHVRIRILGRGEMQLNGQSVEGCGQELIEHHRCVKCRERADAQCKHPRGGGVAGMLGVCGTLYSVGWDRHQVITLMSAMQRSFSAWDKESERKTHGWMATVEVEVVPSCSVLKREGKRRV